MKSQKVFVCETIMSVLKEKGIDYQLNGETPVKEVLTSEMKSTVRQIVFDGFKNSEIQMTEQSRGKYLSDDQKLKEYVNGLVNNWIKKNPEFNGGNTYKPKNPGSRSGQGDEQIRELRKLLKTVTNEKDKELIEQSIQSRLEEIKPESKVEINIDVLPENLKHLVK